MSRAKSSWWIKALQNKMILIVLTMMVVVPFIATPLDIHKTGLAALACEGFGIALLVCLLWRKRPELSKENVLSFLRTGSNLPALLFLAIVGVSLVCSQHFNYSVQEALRIGTGVLVYFVVAYQFRRSEHIARAIDILMYIAIGVSLVAFAQFGLSSTENHYATGIFGDHQLLGSFLMIVLPFVCITAITEPRPNRQLIAQIASVTTIVALLLAQSRSAWAGTAAGVVTLGLVTLWSASRRQKLARRKHEVVMPVMLLVVSLGFFFLVSPEAGNIGDRMDSTFQSHNSAVEYRTQLAAGAIKMIEKSPITGHGIGLYSLYQDRYTHSGMAVTKLRDKYGNYARAGMGEMAHDLYLQTAAEVGVPGAIVFICIPLFFVVGGLHKVRTMDSGVRRSVLLAAIASTVAFAVDAAASPSWQYGQISLFFWITLGLGVGSLRPRSKHYSSSREAEELEEQTALSPTLGFIRGGALALGAVLALVMIPSLVYAFPPNYLVPKSANIEPKKAVIFSFQSQEFTLSVTFTDGETYDVTYENPQTVFSITTAHQGSLGGTNNSVYTASIGPETVGIQGAFTQQSVTVTNATTLSVERGG